MLRKILLSACLVIFVNLASYAQCAMCRTTIVNNVSHGETNVAASLNLGIMYLFFTPYILVALIGFLWYRNSKVNGKKIKFISDFKR